MTTRRAERTHARTSPSRNAGGVRQSGHQSGTGPFYLPIVGVVAALVLMGTLMVLSASTVLSLTTYGSAWHFFVRQTVWTILGVAAFWYASKFDYHRLTRLVQPLMLATCVLLGLVLLPSVGIEAGGARRWLGVDLWRFQPSELAKLALLLFIADLLDRRADEIDDKQRVLYPILIALGVVGALIVFEPDFDSTVLIALVAGSLMIVGGIRFRHLMPLAIAGSALAAYLAISEPYRRARVMTLFDPPTDLANKGYQISQSLIALGSGGISGAGLGAGKSKWLFLPNAHTDFIFSVVGEELGFIGTLLVLTLFVALAFLGVRTALNAPDRFGMLLATGLTVWVSAQAAINIGGVIGILPVSGITLPLISFGGSSLVFTLAAMGILANVARQTRR